MMHALVVYTCVARPSSGGLRDVTSPAPQCTDVRPSANRSSSLLVHLIVMHWQVVRAGGSGGAYTPHGIADNVFVYTHRTLSVVSALRRVYLTGMLAAHVFVG